MTREKVTYRGETIEKMGKGFLYDSILWPKWKLLTTYIDNKFLNMTNSFVSYLRKYHFPDSPMGEEWEYFCESNSAKQVKIIEEYAKDAFDAGQKTDCDDQTNFTYGLKYNSFEEWKNKNE